MILHLLHPSCALMASLLKVLPFDEGCHREDAKNTKIFFKLFVNFVLRGQAC